MNEVARLKAPGIMEAVADHQTLHAGRMALEDAVTPAAEAARRIADAILDDASPLRVACDPLGEAMLVGDDAAGAESRMAAFIAGLAGRPTR